MLLRDRALDLRGDRGTLDQAFQASRLTPDDNFVASFCSRG